MKDETNKKKSIKYTGLAAVDAIIGEWHEKASKSGIEWIWNGELKKNIKVELFDLCILFSNLLSNAVEAACKVEGGKSRFVEVKIGHFNGRIMIKVSNSCILNSIHNTELKTSKIDKENHGFGLKNIERIVEKYDGQILLNCIDCVFVFEITI